ncbi:glycosyltransferase family 52 [Actinobacillus equuli]|uniref:glycosyltransferase family 52 n=1 Tax=Actinobacillus equuli TaxID=718 RepID=UPI002442C742|nr:glycosyltransferase family 52 [Actinobacillus equuli]WGE53199.1 glycosyltransferase family 52 protein [Actinobacillus equuli subsp. haemolyticus]WGE73633.1 glycosyltransferase family 52 protein [Actinobacillus equuli subsp. haemolyticus]WGE79582.1 glycosyltransferase family 52 protein [Actinobacillus equuli subsp. equuli]
MNLIICHTPLQVLVAEKIMQKYPEQEFFGIMFTFESYNNHKFQNYWERFSKLCKEAFLFSYPKSGKLSLLMALLRAKRKVKHFNVEKLFVASIDDQFVQLICSTVNFKQLHTFDDGTANIVKNSIYYQDSPKTLKRKMVNCLLGNRYSTQTLRALSSKHYTIYPNLPNIIENVEAISFATLTPNQTACQNEPIKLLLGQPLFDDAKENIALAEQVIQKFGITAYLPHPRERYHLAEVKYINTDLIFEDYIYQAANEQKYIIYTYFSGAVLNVMNHPNIEVVSIRPQLNNPVYLACYNLFEQVGINIVDI